MSELIDNRAHRIRTLKEIIKRLHAGEAPERVKDQLKALVQETDAGEIAAMEQELMAEGIPGEEILGMCDLHSAVLREILAPPVETPVVPGHPVETFRRENEALGKRQLDNTLFLSRCFSSWPLHSTNWRCRHRSTYALHLFSTEFVKWIH